jgi:hypothetical protein
MAVKDGKTFHYKLHGRHDEITLHISRTEALKLLAGLTCQLQKRRQQGHREFFLLTAKRGHVFHKLTVTHHQAHMRQWQASRWRAPETAVKPSRPMVKLVVQR